VFGFLGERIFLAGFQQALSIAAGALIIFYLAKTFFKKNLKTYQIENSKNKFSFLKNLFAKLYTKNSGLSFLGIGILNGFLPCGFVYIAVAGAAVQKSPIDGALFMVLFGIGTLPLMLGISMSKNFVNINLRRRINKLSPVIAVILALIFIIRGLNLGIPYLSPKFAASKKLSEDVLCH
jgi:sulfite exporter TauE/SafE